MKYSETRTANNMKYFNPKLNIRNSLCSKVTTKIAQKRFKEKEIARITEFLLIGCSDLLHLPLHCVSKNCATMKVGSY